MARFMWTLLLVLGAASALVVPRAACARGRVVVRRRAVVEEAPASDGDVDVLQEGLEGRRALLRDTYRSQDPTLVFLVLLPPLAAALMWPALADGVSTVFSTFNGINGRAVDGNAFAVQLLRPTVNGVILPTLSIALGTLLATTINVLRNRQVAIRANLNKEACELRLLRSALLGAFGTAQHAQRRLRALTLLRGYCARVVAESTVGAFDVVAAEALAGGVGANELEPLATMLHGVEGAFASRESSVAASVGLVASLNGHRSDRLAALLGGFPPIHWFVLGQLALSIVLAFLIESNQEVLQFLNSLQLRILFALLIAVCSGTSALCVDLADPFRGRFSIITAAQQVADLEILLADDAERADRGVHAPLSSNDDWGHRETLKFHLLTSPYAAPVRALGDAAAATNNLRKRALARRRARRRPPHDSKS